MFAIELYRKYLYNSTKGISNKDKANKLSFERQKISNILNAVDDLFYMDKSVTDKEDSSIYTYIKRGILADAWLRGREAACCESKFFLQGILNEIEIMQEAMVA